MKWKVTKEVNISEFGTNVLIAELFNRIGDYTHDPEPKHDPTLERLSPERLEEIMTVLRKAI